MSKENSMCKAYSQRDYIFIQNLYIYNIDEIMKNTVNNAAFLFYRRLQIYFDRSNTSI